MADIEQYFIKRFKLAFNTQLRTAYFLDFIYDVPKQLYLDVI